LDKTYYQNCCDGGNCHRNIPKQLIIHLFVTLSLTLALPKGLHVFGIWEMYLFSLYCYILIKFLIPFFFFIWYFYTKNASAWYISYSCWYCAQWSCNIIGRSYYSWCFYICWRFKFIYCYYWFLFNINYFTGYPEILQNNR
jgi:hypothetical protein